MEARPACQRGIAVPEPLVFKENNIRSDGQCARNSSPAKTLEVGREACSSIAALKKYR